MMNKDTRRRANSCLQYVPLFTQDIHGNDVFAQSAQNGRQPLIVVQRTLPVDEPFPGLLHLKRKHPPSLSQHLCDAVHWLTRSLAHIIFSFSADMRTLSDWTSASCRICFSM